jgi:Domain of unknown function (DUF4262)
MITALDAPVDKLDEHELNFVSNVKKHGWFATHVFAEEKYSGFSYSTGFYLNLGHAEIIISGLKREIAHQVLWDAYKDIEAGNSFPLGVPLNTVFANGRAAFFNVAPEHYQEYLGWSSWFYGGQRFPCVQLVWTDKDDRFPWDSKFDHSFDAAQPDLTNSGWKQELAS